MWNHLAPRIWREDIKMWHIKRKDALRPCKCNDKNLDMPSTNKVGAWPHTVYIQSVGFFSGCLLFKNQRYKINGFNCKDVEVIRAVERAYRRRKKKKKQLSWQTSLFFRTEDQALSDTLQHPVTAEERLTQAMLELTFNGWFIQEKAHAFHRSLARARVMYSDV